MSVYHPQEPFDFQQDRDLVALMNEARSPEQLHELTLAARARVRARRRGLGSAAAGHRSTLRRFLALRA